LAPLRCAASADEDEPPRAKHSAITHVVASALPTRPAPFTIAASPCRQHVDARGGGAGGSAAAAARKARVRAATAASVSGDGEDEDHSTAPSSAVKMRFEETD
jgi:hypothetical protein